jgi:acyl dehydratase
MRTFASADELRAAVGEHLGYSDWHVVDQERVNLFADATGDHQWIHVDPERAKAGPFGTTIAHGYLTLSLIPMLMGEVVSYSGVKMGVNYGCNKVRFPAPVPVGGSLQATAEIVAVDPGKGSARVTVRVAVRCDRAERPVCVADVVILFVG